MNKREISNFSQDGLRKGKNRLQLCNLLCYIISIIVVLLALFAAPVQAQDGLSGTLGFLLALSPAEGGRESVPFNTDFETSLQANLPLNELAFTILMRTEGGVRRSVLTLRLSELTFAADTVGGPAGLEHAIWGFSADLGGILLHDEFWFAAPFDGGGIRLGDLQFVKKRVTIKASGGGISFRNLAIIEDVHFDHPYSAPLREPEYRFGDILTVSGKTSGGIQIGSVTGICADPDKENKVKKFKKKGTVCKTGQLELTIERITLKKIHIAGLRIDQTLEFKPQQPFYSKTILSRGFRLLEDVTLAFSASLVTTDLYQISGGISLSLNGALIQTPHIQLNLAGKKVEFHFVLPFDSGSLKGKTIITQGKGITSQEFVLGISRPRYSFANTTKLSGNGNLSFESAKFALAIPLDAFAFKTEATYIPSGLSDAKLGLVLNF